MFADVFPSLGIRIERMRRSRRGGALLRIMTPRLHRIPEEAHLSRLRDLPRAEAIRIAMIKYGWDAATAAKRVDVEREKPGQHR